MEQRVQEERGVGRLRGHARYTAHRKVGAAGTVQKLEVGEYRLTRPRQANRDPVLHPIEVQRLLEVLAADHPGAVPGLRGDEDLRGDARDLHVRSVGNVRGHQTLGDPKGIGIEGRTLVLLAHDVDDAVEAHGLPGRSPGFRQHQIIELDDATRLDAEPELERRRFQRPEHHAPVLLLWLLPLGVHLRMCVRLSHDAPLDG
jgi:hypothetical protein